MATDRRTYVVYGEAWYARGTSSLERNVTEEVTVSREGEDGWEFLVTWHDLSRGRPPFARVEIFDDAWAAFAEVPELFADLATAAASVGDGPSLTVAEVRILLERLGFVDTTARVR